MSDTPPIPETSDDGDTAGHELLANLAEDFACRLRRGERPTVEEYAKQHPALAAQIRELFPALLAIEQESPFGPTLAASSGPAAEGAGSTIGRYRLLERIGEGGFGVVYMAEQQHPVRRKVALKLIKPGLDTRQVISRFEAERQALAMMDHPNIATVLDAGATEAGRPYFVMELVKGTPITAYCDQHHLSLRTRLELMLPVCQAIQHAHHKGVIHRDIKPTNVLVAEHDDVPVPKVIDFGVAKAVAQDLTGATLFTGFGQIVGTVEYMSPEQAKLNQLDVDTRSDVYSLGVLLYELLTGTTPFSRKRLCDAAFEEMLRIIREEDPPKPSTRLGKIPDEGVAAGHRGEPADPGGLVKGDLDLVVMKCLAKDRGARYASAADLALDLRNWLRGEPLSVAPPGLTSLLRVWLRHNLGSVGWAITLGVVWGVLGGLVCWLMMLNPLHLSVGSRRAIYLAGVAAAGGVGLATVWLVRPKNAAADLAGGTISGLLAAVICYALSWGWVAVLIAGVPHGIWIGMTTVVLVMGSTCLIETVAAGSLLRRHGSIPAVIGPYVELVVPAILAVVFLSSTLFRMVTTGLGDRAWHPFMVPVLGLTVAAVLMNWNWRTRAVLHAAWVITLCAASAAFGPVAAQSTPFAH